jgi:hypothetical protein
MELLVKTAGSKASGRGLLWEGDRFDNVGVLESV